MQCSDWKIQELRAFKNRRVNTEGSRSGEMQKVAVIDFSKAIEGTIKYFRKRFFFQILITI